MTSRHAGVLLENPWLTLLHRDQRGNLGPQGQLRNSRRAPAHVSKADRGRTGLSGGAPGKREVLVSRGRS